MSNECRTVPNKRTYHDDDILILSKDAIGLQRSLDILDRFCNTWNMEVNIEKQNALLSEKEQSQ